MMKLKYRGEEEYFICSCTECVDRWKMSVDYKKAIESDGVQQDMFPEYSSKQGPWQPYGFGPVVMVA